MDDDKTSDSMVPDAPMNLTAELARDTNFSGVGNRGVLVLWNAPSDPAGDPITGYKIERKVDDGEFEEKVSSRSYTMTHWVDTDEPSEGEVRVYRVTSINGKGIGTEMAMVMIPLAMHTHNMAPTAVGTIGAQSVMMGETSSMNVSGYFNDPDGDTLSYSSTSDDTGVATVNAMGNPVMVTGVAVGTANITVKAMDPDGAYVEQMFMVTVTAAMLGMPGTPMLSDTTVSPGNLTIEVTWTNAPGALSHLVLLFDTSDYSLAKPAATNQDNGMTTFSNLDPGSYLAVVVAYDADGNIQLAISGVQSVGGG